MRLRRLLSLALQEIFYLRPSIIAIVRIAYCLTHRKTIFSNKIFMAGIKTKRGMSMVRTTLFTSKGLTPLYAQKMLHKCNIKLRTYE